MRHCIFSRPAASTVLGALAFSGLFAALPAAAAPSAAEARAQEAWRAAIDATPVPHEGCFTASFPTVSWTEVKCVAAPKRPYLPRNGLRSRTVGNGNDYAAVTSKITLSAVGSFPTVTGVKSETGYGGVPNDYTLQLNSDFMSTAGCNGSSDPSNCATWQQFIYSSGENAVFMQYWLINYGSTCPSGGWMSYSGSCYKNSNAVTAPTFAITGLHSLKIHAAAVKGKTDTVELSTATKAYTVTGKDSVVDLATAWTGSEFNIVGDGGGSQAKFNKGSSITVEIALKDGSTAAPTCQSDDGTTGETNNLTLGACTATKGTTPYIKFIEKN